MATGNVPPELIPQPIPVGCEQIWRVFLELNGRRGGGGFGASPIALADILAWQTLMGVILTPWETETLLHLDCAALAAQATEPKT